MNEKRCIFLMMVLISSFSFLGLSGMAHAQVQASPISNRCPVKNIQHWDKIIFSIISPDFAKKVNLSANTELDIKVLDNPKQVADLKQKVLNFLGNPSENKTSLKIIDVEYAIVCAAFLQPAFQTQSFDYIVTSDNRLQINVVFNKPCNLFSSSIKHI
jgi:hypothetical protein